MKNSHKTVRPLGLWLLPRLFGCVLLVASSARTAFAQPVNCAWTNSTPPTIALNFSNCSVGIGTAPPFAKLDVRVPAGQTGANPVIQLVKDDSVAGQAGLIFGATGAYGFFDYDSDSS